MALKTVLTEVHISFPIPSPGIKVTVNLPPYLDTPAEENVLKDSDNTGEGNVREENRRINL